MSIFLSSVVGLLILPKKSIRQLRNERIRSFNRAQSSVHVKSIQQL